MASDRGAFGFVLISVSVDADGDRSMYFSHLGVYLISVKPLTTENTENKTTPKISKITVSQTASQTRTTPVTVWCPIFSLVGAFLLIFF